MIPRIMGSVIVSVVAFVLVASGLQMDSASARNLESARTTGIIVASDVYLLAKNFDSIATLKDAMNRMQQPQPITACCNGAWRVHFAALLERPSDQAMLNMEFFDVSSGDRQTAPSRVFTSVVPVRPGEVAVFVNDFVISKEMGFTAGHTYEVSLRPASEADQTVLAKGLVMIK